MASTLPERHTESLVERILVESGYDRDLIGYQRALDEDVQRLLPSKRRGGKPGAGKPEVVYRLGATEVLINECKASVRDHASAGVSSAPDLDACPLESEKYAEDGVLCYLRGVRQGFAALGVAVSGVRRNAMRVSVFRALPGKPIERTTLTAIPSLKQAKALLAPATGPELAAKDLDRAAEDLHNFLRDQMELSEQEKPLLVSAILLALEWPAFRRSYRNVGDGEEMAADILDTVEKKLTKDRIPPEKIEAMMATYAFIRTNKPLRQHVQATVKRIDDDIYSRIKGFETENYDVLGEFYGEFLKYSGGDKKGLGIVLTPRQTTTLFARMAGVDRDTVLLDTCTGTSGFLIAGMAEMLRDAGNDQAARDRIKREQLIGIEFNDRMFTLACANMLLRGDGKSNMFFGSCFDPTIGARINPERVERELRTVERQIVEAHEELDEARTTKTRGAVTARIEELLLRRREVAAALSGSGSSIPRVPDVAILNPPYAKKDGDKHELAFIYEACSLLKAKGLCIAIIPLSCASDDSAVGREWKRRLMAEHTLEAVVSMPEQLFPTVGVVSCAMVFRAHRPHKADYRTWLALWKDDGFKLKKGRRVEVRPWDGPNGTEAQWLADFRSRIQRPQISMLKALAVGEEWCAEAHLEPDYETLGEKAIHEAHQQYVLYLMQKEADRAAR